MENQEKQEQIVKSEPKKALATRAELVSFAFGVGSSIAVPLVIFALIGRLLDRNFGTGHIFLILGLLLSLISTTIIMIKKVKNFL